jgi:diguanylate cyclase (GGDEF)-like protein/PAS domain S-box-containing protein
MSDSAFRYVLGNPPRLAAVDIRVETLLGYHRQQFLTAKVNLRDLVHKDDTLFFDSLFASPTPAHSGSFNVRIRHADGRIRCVKGSFTRTQASQGETELELQLADARMVKEPGDATLINSFKTLIEQTADSIYIKNRNHVLLAASRNMVNLSESARDRNEFVGKTDYDLLPEAAADLMYQMEERAYAEGRRVNEILQMVAQDGTRHWLDDRKYPINGPSGEFIGIFGVAPDISEAIESRQKLHESDGWLRDAQEIAGLSSYELDIPRMAWKVSPELEALLGIDASYDHKFEGLWPLIHPDDRPTIAKHLEGYFAGELKSFDSEYRILRHTDGATRWVHTRGRLERDAQGKPLALRGTVQDVTERKQAEAALRENKELLQLFLKHVPVALAMLDREMHYLAVSPRWIEMHSLQGRELIGRSHYEIFPQIPDDWKAEHRRALAGESINSGEVSLTMPDGSVLWLRRETRPWLNSDGAVGGVIIFSENITERKLAEEELRRHKELLQLFIQHAPVALAMFDSEMRYLAVSKLWAQDHDLDAEQIIGRSHYDVNPDVPDRWRETHRRGLAGERQVVEEDRYERFDGKVEWIRWQIMPWQAADGSIGGIVMFYEDITERKLTEAAVRESKELLQLFIDKAPAALAMFDREMRYVAVSRRWLEDYSLVGRDVIGHSHYEIVPDVPERWKEAHRRGLAGETLKADEELFERADGTVQWIRWEVVPWRTGDGLVGGIVLFAEDVTEKKLGEERLRRAASVFTGAREGITITDLSGTILDVNDAFTRITGYTREDVLGRNPRLLKSGLQSKEFYEKMWNSIQRDGHWSGEIWNRSKNGDIFAEMLTINAIRDANGLPTQYVSLFSDITEIKRHEQQLEHMAHYDALTGLPNRVLFANRLRQAMAQALRNKQMLAVAYFDVDGFKTINDEHGHSVGDALLTAIAFRLRRVMREGDTLGRLGGDEFAAVLLDAVNPEMLAPALKRMLAAASEEVQIGEALLCVSASCGVTYYPQHEEVDADVLLRQAGQAMYQAKLAGKNRCHDFDSGEDLLTRTRHENLEHIRQALDSQQFVLHYQPKVNMRTGKIIGAEALLRWRHPERGLLPPGMFLPVIEEHPLTIELGQWVIESVLNQMETWQADGFDLPVSVNLSAMELQQPDFADRLRHRLEGHPSVKPSSLELEVLETSALEDVVQASQAVAACREIGVSIALDDFGIGYSSLTYLKRLPANVLKIDQSFVRDMIDDPENLNILEGILGLAAAFRRNVIAEGVETVEHGLMLLQMGCELAQGYGIARPMPAAELRVWAATWRPDPRWADVPPVHAENRPVLYACVEHRAWLSAFEACLLGKRTSPPPLDATHCRVSAWLNAEKQTARGTLSTVRAIETLHHQLHSLAAEIFASQSGGHNSEGLARLQQLHHLHDKCLARLRAFTRADSRKGGRRAHSVPSKHASGH